MSATKYTLKVEAEALDPVVFKDLLHKLLHNLNHQIISGEIEMSDGDRIDWDIKQKKVTF